MKYTYSILLLLAATGTITAADDFYPEFYEERPEPITVTPFTMPSDAELRRMTVPDIQQLDDDLTKHIETSNLAWWQQNECKAYCGWATSLYLPAATCSECLMSTTENPCLRMIYCVVPPIIGAYYYSRWTKKPTAEQAAMKRKLDSVMQMKEKHD